MEYHIKRNIDNPGLFVDEGFDEPGAGEAVDLGPFAGDPFMGLKVGQYCVGCFLEKTALFFKYAIYT